MTTRNIEVDLMARVEGEGALEVVVDKGEVKDVRLKIFEAPRFFEAFLKGRHYSEVPDIVARICGICPVAYQMSAVHAIESAFGMEVSETVRKLRRLLYCGEWIESHSLHVYMLHAPDFLGLDSGLELARSEPEILRRGLRLKKVGDRILTVLGGRAVHPVSVCIGGFTRLPQTNELRSLLDELHWAREAAKETLAWVAGFEMPDLSPGYTFAALSGNVYPMNEGAITVSRDGTAHDMSCASDGFEGHFKERQAPYSTAMQCLLDEKPYLVGPMARLNLNAASLRPVVREALAEAGVELPLVNPYHAIIARSAEVLQAVDEAIELIEDYEGLGTGPGEPYRPVTPKESVGTAVTEAPRGMLYHRYALDADGRVVEANIVPPTSQNQARMEADLWQMIPSILSLSDEALAAACERVIRCYDPCISCATHFLRLKRVAA